MGSPEDGGKDQDQGGDQKADAQAVSEGLARVSGIATEGARKAE
jgi:hypothetical protein